MKKIYEALCFLAAFPFIITERRAFSIPLQTQEQPRKKYAPYEGMLDESMSGKAIIVFIVKNNCSPTDQFQMCVEIDIALWADSDQIVSTIDLYPEPAEGFKRYQGKLPFDMTFYDPMWRLQEKLKVSSSFVGLQRGAPPDEPNSSDHIHCWAIHKRRGVTFIYNSSSADEDACSYAVLVHR